MYGRSQNPLILNKRPAGPSSLSRRTISSCTGPRIGDTDLRLRGHGHWADLIGADLSGRFVAVPLDDPALVVGLPKGDERQAKLLDRVEAADPQQVLLQGPDEALGTAIALGLAHEGRRALDAKEADLGLEVVADVLAAVVVAQPEAGGDPLGERAEALAHRLRDRLERREPVGAAAGVDADALGRAMIDGDEQRPPALARHDRGQIAAPHDVDPLGGDPAVMGSRAMRAAGTLMGQEAVLAHQPQDAAPAGADTGEAQPRPQLAVALAMKRAAGQEQGDRCHQVVIRRGPAWPRPLALSHAGWAAVAIKSRARHAPEARDALQAVDLVRGGRDLPAHGLDLP